MYREDIFIIKLNSSYSDEELISDVRRCIKLVAPNYLSASKYNEIGKYHSDTISKRFGNRKWLNALKFISGNDQDYTLKHSDIDLLENLANVWIAKSGQPTRRDMDNHPTSKISSGAYIRRYKKWNNALIVFKEYINSNDDKKFELKSIGNNIVHRTPREPSNRLKVQVLLRDGNICKACNRLCDGINLNVHFDHIVPWSKGGETTYENLRVLCNECNEALGNANILNDGD